MARPRKVVDDTETQAEPTPVARKPEAMVGVTIRWIEAGDSVKYTCSGFHLQEDHKVFLPEGKRKLEPGDVIELPESIANEYLKDRRLEKA